MNGSSKDQQPYGLRFAEAWEQLQRYLGDLDADELRQVASQDFEGTLKTLKAQPAIGHSGALNSAEMKHPEELAVSIVRERLRALTDHQAEGDDVRFGADFLRHWKELGGSLARFRYATIQDLKQADREEAVRTLSKIWPPWATKALKRESAREAAKTVFTRMEVMSRHSNPAVHFLGGFYG